MGSPYSIDLRERVVAAVASGMSRRGAAKLYQVSYSAVINWVSRSVRTGNPAALPMGGKKPFKLLEESDWILRRLTEKPDITGRELLAELHGREIDVSYYAVWHFLDRAGLALLLNNGPAVLANFGPPPSFTLRSLRRDRGTLHGLESQSVLSSTEK